jgi:hypothetical protein
LDSNVPEYRYNQQKKEVHFSSFMVNFGNI